MLSGDGSGVRAGATEESAGEFWAAHSEDAQAGHAAAAMVEEEDSDECVGGACPLPRARK